MSVTRVQRGVRRARARRDGACASRCSLGAQFITPIASASAPTSSIATRFRERGAPRDASGHDVAARARGVASRRQSASSLRERSSEARCAETVFRIAPHFRARVRAHGRRARRTSSRRYAVRGRARAPRRSALSAPGKGILARGGREPRGPSGKRLASIGCRKRARIIASPCVRIALHRAGVSRKYSSVCHHCIDETLRCDGAERDVVRA